MVQQLIYTDEKEDKKISKLSKEFEISKAETIKKIIREFSKERKRNKKNQQKNGK